MLGQPASWHTVWRPSRCTRPRRCVYSGPIFAETLIHGGLRSIGVSALRASMRSRRRPSGTTAVTRESLRPRPAQPSGTRLTSRLRGFPIGTPGNHATVAFNDTLVVYSDGNPIDVLRGCPVLDKPAT